MAANQMKVQVEVKDAQEIKRIFMIANHKAQRRSLWFALGGMGAVDLTIMFGIRALWIEVPFIAFLFYWDYVVTPLFHKRLAADDAAHELRTED